MTSDAPYSLIEENLSTFAADTPLLLASKVAEPDEDDYTGINWDRLKGF